MANPLIDTLTPIAKAAKNTDRFFWANIVAINPIRVQEDTASSPLEITPTSLTPLTLRDRVFCLRYGRRLIILGRQQAGTQIFQIQKTSSHLQGSRGTNKNNRVILNVEWKGGMSVKAWDAHTLGTIPAQYRPSKAPPLVVPAYTNQPNQIWALGVSTKGEVYLSTANEATHPNGTYSATIIYDID